MKVKKYSIEEIRALFFPYLGIQSKEFQEKGELVAAAWSDGYKKAMMEVYEKIHFLSKSKRGD